jgi:hypothetical protein
MTEYKLGDYTVTVEINDLAMHQASVSFPLKPDGKALYWFESDSHGGWAALLSLSDTVRTISDCVLELGSERIAIDLFELSTQIHQLGLELSPVFKPNKTEV